MAETIKKRDGTIVEFQAEKITQAIRLAGERTGEFDKNTVEEYIEFWVRHERKGDE